MAYNMLSKKYARSQAWQAIPMHVSGPWTANPWSALLYVEYSLISQHIHIDTLASPSVDPGALALRVEECLRAEMAGLDALTVQVARAELEDH